jgi:hypothetical protein
MNDTAKLRAEKASLPQKLAVLEEKKTMLFNKYEEDKKKLEALQERVRGRDNQLDNALRNQEIKCKEYILKINNQYNLHFVSISETPVAPVEATTTGEQDATASLLV